MGQIGPVPVSLGLKMPRFECCCQQTMRLSHNKVTKSSISSLEPPGRPSPRTYQRSCSNTMSTTTINHAKNYRWYCWQMWHDRNSLQLTCTSTVTQPQVLASRDITSRPHSYALWFSSSGALGYVRSPLQPCSTLR